jgi:hypothetical protein
MKLDVVVKHNLFILKLDNISSCFHILKPELLDEIVKGFKECSDESQVMMYSTCMISMGALSII